MKTIQVSKDKNFRNLVSGLMAEISESGYSEANAGKKIYVDPEQGQVYILYLSSGQALKDIVPANRLGSIIHLKDMFDPENDYSWGYAENKEEVISFCYKAILDSLEIDAFF